MSASLTSGLCRVGQIPLHVRAKHNAATAPKRGYPMQYPACRKNLLLFLGFHRPHERRCNERSMNPIRINTSARRKPGATRSRNGLVWGSHPGLGTLPAIQFRWAPTLDSRGLLFFFSKNQGIIQLMEQQFPWNLKKTQRNNCVWNIHPTSSIISES